MFRADSLHLTRTNAWVRLLAPSLPKMLLRCFLTVPTMTISFSPIALLERPSLTWRRISNFAFAQRFDQVLAGSIGREVA